MFGETFSGRKIKILNKRLKGTEKGIGEINKNNGTKETTMKQGK